MRRRMARAGEQEVVETPATAGPPARVPRRAAGTDATASLSSLQAMAGNRAVTQLLAARPALVLQRDGPALEDLVGTETGITVERDTAPQPTGARYSVPTRLQLDKRPASGKGRWLTLPSFHLRMDPRHLVFGLLDQVSLGRGLRLTNPTLVFEPGSNSVTAAGTVSIPTPYPPAFDSPLNVGIRIRSTGLEKFAIQGGVGPFLADITLTLDYDSEPLRQLLSRLQAGDLVNAASGAGQLDRDAGFRLSGTAGVGGRGGKVPLTYLRGSGTVSPQGVRGWGGAAGVIGLPAGTFHPELAAPAAGVALGAGSLRPSGSADVVAGFGGVTGTPDIQKLLTGDFAGGFVPFAYAQVTGMHRTKDGHVFSIQISGRLAIGDDQRGVSGLEQLRAAVDTERQGVRYPVDEGDEPWRRNIDPSVTAHRRRLSSSPAVGSGVSITLSGTFDLFGSK